MSPRSGPLAAAASAALASSGIVGTLLAGVSPADAATVTEAGRVAVTAAPKVCGQPPAAAKTKALRAGGTEAILDAATVIQATPKPTTSATQASATPDASATPGASSSAASTPSPSASASSTPTADPTAVATPTPSPSASSTSSSPSPTASPSPSATKSSTPAPSPSPTATKTVTLCLKVQPLGTSGVRAGSKAGYAIWVWPVGGAATSVSVTISAKVAARAATPAFTVCPSAAKLTCTVGGISAGTSDELQATVPVPAQTSAGRDAILSVKAKSGNTAAPPAATGTIKVTAASSPSGPPAPSLSPAGAGASLPIGVLPTVPGAVGAAATLPELPSPQSSLGSLFPTVQPGSSASPVPSLPDARNVKVADTAATFPFSTRLIGGEIAGLAVLAAALAIGIVRFSLRRPRPQHGKDPGS